jgi:glutamate dehydrogenase/leucine dehydrogenase
VSKYKHMIIRFTIGGAIVRIGCRRIPFTNKEAMKRAFCRYIDDPEGYEKEMLANDWAVQGDDQTLGTDR